MKQAIIALMLAAALAGCASTGTPVVPALHGKARVPVNKEIPSTVPLSQPNNPETQED